MDDDVGVASDRRGEVGVEGHVEGIMAEKLLVLNNAGAEIHRHLEKGEEFSKTRQDHLQAWTANLACRTFLGKPTVISLMIFFLHFLKAI